MRALKVRSAALSGYAGLARSLGLDPAALARQVGLSLRNLATPDTLIPARKAYRLMELSAAASQVPDFGLRLATRRSLSHLGTLGLLVRDEPDVRSAVQRMVADMNLHSTCVVLQLHEARGIAVVALTVLADGEPEIRQAVESGVGLLYQILSHLLSPAWRPLAVHFVHAAGASVRPHRQFFGCPVHFSAEHNAVVLHTRELDQGVPGSDRGLRAYARLPAMAGLAVDGPDTGERVRQTILQLMPQGDCTSEAVAERLGMHRRTLQRHLGAQGTDFSGVLRGLRLELAQQYLAAGMLSMTDIAQLLGFQALSSFTRWFTLEAGCAPSRWRPAGR